MKLKEVRARNLEKNIPKKLQEPMKEFLKDLNGVSAGSPKFHEEFDLLEHSLMVYDEMKKLNDTPIALAMALTHDAGKLETQDQENDAGHDIKGVEVIEERFGGYGDITEALKAGSRYHHKIKNVTGWEGNQPMNETKVIELISELKETNVFGEILDLAEADAKGRIPSKEFDREKTEERLQKAEDAVVTVDIEYSLEKRGGEKDDYSAEALKNMVTQDRAEFLKEQQSL